MPHSFGLRARTRKKFSQPFRAHGAPNLTTYLTNYKLGDMVDIKANSSVHRGMPHRIYHGKTGKVWDITPRAVGVELLKRVREKLIRKRIHVRVEHIKKSNCGRDFTQRLAANSAARKQHKTAVAAAKTSKGAAPAAPVLKRTVSQPRPAQLIKLKQNKIETVTPIRYELLI
eukprot:TRINITY_DN146_c0_g1_i1.p1 TRINITY_DN146_c0_g1~~TRINITY_DN146_c0_g1_i1.p1  ORF type:complete len:172 (-),score=40.61 TRINITY_DN146_c0_g1_i1:77-592(-)